MHVIIIVVAVSMTIPTILSQEIEPRKQENPPSFHKKKINLLIP